MEKRVESRRTKIQSRQRVIFILFFISGATGLIYEVVWSKYLALLFGSTIQAQTVVLGIFMLGLALGSRWFGKESIGLKNPLLVYGGIEVAIGAWGFFFYLFYGGAEFLFVKIGSSVLERPFLLLLLKILLSAGLLLPPTLLMGGTLPVLAEWLKRRERGEAGRGSAWFYAMNTFGAVVGAGLTGFFLVALRGLGWTLWFAGMLNTLVGLTVILLVRQMARRPEVGGEKRVLQKKKPNLFKADIPTIGFFLVALTGGVSMGLEVLASRALALVFGASLQAFAVVLMAFILGIGMGSVIVASRRGKMKRNLELVSVGLLLGGATALLLFVQEIEGLATFFHRASAGLARNEIGYRYHLALSCLISLVVIGLPAGMLGSILPLWMREAGESESGLGRQVGRLLFWNTLGSVSGVMLTGFVLMPVLGLRGAFGGMAVALGATALWISWRRRSISRVLASAILLIALGAVLTRQGENWRIAMSSGVFRMRNMAANLDVTAFRKQYARLLFYEDAADATVSVEQEGEKGPDDPKHQLALRINGKVDASSRGDLSTQYLLGHLPMLARPESSDVFVFGYGSGVTAGAVLGHPIKRLTIAENCEPVLKASRYFEPWNRGALKDPRTRVFREDARTVLLLGREKYDVIVSEPSNPWTAGIGSVFSQEFYEIAANHLKEGGIMVQWFHIYEINDDITAMVLRTFGSVFPYVEIWDASDGDIILLGSNRPWKSNPEIYRKGYARELPRKDLTEIGLPRPEMLWLRQIASQRTAFAIPGSGVVQSDEYPVLEYEAPKTFFMELNSEMINSFDERTWQLPLATAARREVMRSLGNEGIWTVFHEYHSMNGILNREIALGLNEPEKFLSQNWVKDLNLMPFGFCQPPGGKITSRSFSGLSEGLKKLVQAVIAMQLNPSDWRRQSQVMRETLISGNAMTPMEAMKWSPTFLLSFAVRAAIQAGDLDEAHNLVQFGLQFDKGSPQMHYFRRIIQREKDGVR